MPLNIDPYLVMAAIECACSIVVAVVIPVWFVMDRCNLYFRGQS